jgi:hypothetical protein
MNVSSTRGSYRKLFALAYDQGSEALGVVRETVSALFERVVPPRTVRRFVFEQFVAPVGQVTTYLSGAYAAGKYVAAPVGQACIFITRLVSPSFEDDDGIGDSDIFRAAVGMGAIACATLCALAVTQCREDFARWKQENS